MRVPTAEGYEAGLHVAILVQEHLLALQISGPTDAGTTLE